MRVAIFMAGLVALAYAAPYPQDSEVPDDDEEPENISAPFPTPTVPTILTTSLNIPVTIIPEPGRPTTSRKPPHKEPIPIFSKACTCDIATVHYPCWATDALQRCVYEENFSYGCNMAAFGGCPAPTRTCKDLFQPTPRPGKHPCELGPNPPLNTSTPNLPISIPATLTLNVSMSATISANVTLPITLPV